MSFVYFVGEEDGGPIKIGWAKDPLKRLRGLQTGNPRRLRIEYVLVGDGDTERLMHELWEHFAIKSKRKEGKVDTAPGTEWFRDDIREKLEPILKTAGEKQAACIKAAVGEDLYLDHLERAVREAHAHHGYEFKGRDEVRLLGAHTGYVLGSRRSRL